MKQKYNQSLASIDLVIKKLDSLSAIVSRRENKFGDAVLLDEANWGLMYAKTAIQSLIVDIQIREDAKNEKAQGNKKEKPQVRGSSSVGHGKVLNKSNNRVGRKTKGI